MIRFRFLSGDVNFTTYGGKWISNKQTDEDGVSYWFVVELINWVESVGEREAPGATYHMSLSIVSPQEAGEKSLKSAYDCCGVDEEMIETATQNGHLEELQVESLHAYGSVAPVWQNDGNNWRMLFRDARQQAAEAAANVDAAMDKTVNRIGSTAREYMRGDVLSPLFREGGNEQAKRIMRKMHGVG